MTTIAYDGHEMTGDRRVTEGGVILGSMTKVFKIQAEFEGEGPWFLVGIVGNSSYMGAMLNYVRSHFRPGDKPKIAEGEPDVEALVVYEDGRVAYFEAPDYNPQFIDAGFHALGSGAKFAKTAMYLGRPAKAAVLTAAEFDVYTGKETDTVRF